jgi:hypothetical protein
MLQSSISLKSKSQQLSLSLISIVSTSGSLVVCPNRNKRYYQPSFVTVSGWLSISPSNLFEIVRPKPVPPNF